MKKSLLHLLMIFFATLATSNLNAQNSTTNKNNMCLSVGYPDVDDAYRPYGNGSWEKVSYALSHGYSRKMLVTAGEKYTIYCKSAEGVQSYITISNSDFSEGYAAGYNKVEFIASKTENIHIILASDDQCNFNFTLYSSLNIVAGENKEQTGCNQHFLHENTTGGLLMTEDPEYNLYADDILLDSTITQFRMKSINFKLSPVSGEPDFTSVKITFRKDLNGKPGEIFSILELPSPQEVEELPEDLVGFPVYRVKYDFSNTPVEFPIQPNSENRYWLTFSGNTESGINPYIHMAFHHEDYKNSYLLESTDHGETWSFDTTHFSEDYYAFLFDFESDCNMLGVSETAKQNISIYPNPVENTLNFSNHNVISNVKIVSQTGQIAKNTTSINNASLDVSSLIKGNYLALITLKDGTQQVIKFIKK